MQKFLIPQFIDVESKIIGPITTRQFVIVLAGLLFGFIAYKLSDFALFILEAFIIFVLIVLFAFVKVNNMPFHIFLLNYLRTIISPNVRVWKRQSSQVTQKKEDEDELTTQNEPPKSKRLPTSRLSELSLIIDTGGYYQGEEIINQENVKTPHEEQKSQKSK